MASLRNILGPNKCTGNTTAQITDGGTDTIFVAKIQTLTYTGDGGIAQHIDTNITPLYVRIWNRQTVDGAIIVAIETIDTIIDDHANGGAIWIAGAGAGENQFLTDRIISLDADGFTVDDAGADGHPNKNGQVYNVLVLGY